MASNDQMQIANADILDNSCLALNLILGSFLRE